MPILPDAGPEVKGPQSQRQEKRGETANRPSNEAGDGAAINLRLKAWMDMGVDMSGWVEVKNATKYGGVIPPVAQRWYGVVQTDFIVERDLDMFGMLFGIENFTNLAPVVGIRGLPPDLSPVSQRDSARWGTFAQTWITWQEIRAIAWDEEAVDGRPRLYARADDGQLVLRGKSAPNEGDVIEEGRTWEDRGNTRRVERISRREVLDTSREWRLLFDLMARLAQDYGDEYVRLVAWFDR